MQLGSQMLDLGPALLDARPGLADFVDRDVVVGIRPEQMEDSTLEQRSDEHVALLTADVELREALGSELLVHLRIDARPAITDDIRQRDCGRRRRRHRGARAAGRGGRGQGRQPLRHPQPRQGRRPHRGTGQHGAPALVRPGHRRRDPRPAVSDRIESRDAPDRRDGFASGLHLGRLHVGVPDRGWHGARRGRHVDLGHVRVDARQRAGRSRRSGRRRPPWTDGRGRRADGRPRDQRLPVLGLVAAGAAVGEGSGEPGRTRLLPGTGRRAGGPRHRTGRHPLPLGSPAGAGGRRRLAGPRHRLPLR